MSAESAGHSSEPSESKTRPSRSPVEKVVWGIIALVILGLGLELYAKNSYENTMATIDEVFNRPHPDAQRLSDVRKLISGLTRSGAPVPSETSSTQEEIEVSWLSPSSKYAFTLVLEKGDEDPVVAWYKMGGENWVADPYAAVGEEVAGQSDGTPSATDMPGGMMDGMPGGGGSPAGQSAEGSQPGGSGQGGGGRGRGGDSGRPQRPASDDSDDAAPAADSDSASSGQ